MTEELAFVPMDMREELEEICLGHPDVMEALQQKARFTAKRLLMEYGYAEFAERLEEALRSFLRAEAAQKADA